MSNEQALIDALNQTIKVQSELIVHLKDEISRLAAISIYPSSHPPYPQFPIGTTIIGTPPDYTASPGSVPFTIIGGPLPLGSQQLKDGTTTSITLTGTQVTANEGVYSPTVVTNTHEFRGNPVSAYGAK